MAETEVAVVKFGATITWTDFGADGHFYKNDANTLVYIQNSTGSDVTLTHVEQGTCDFGHPQVNQTDSAPNGGVTRIWAAKNSVRWNDSAGRAHVTIAGAPGDSTLQIACVTYKDT